MPRLPVLEVGIALAEADIRPVATLSAVAGIRSAALPAVIIQAIPTRRLLFW